MERKMNLFVFFVIFLQIDQSMSAIFWNFGYINSGEDYTHSRSTSVHRGLLLSYSPAKKHEICQDLFNSQLYAQHHDLGNFIVNADQSSTTPLISDGETTEGERQYPLSVKKIITYSKPKEDRLEEDILFTCVGNDFKHRQPNVNGEYMLSTAFRPSWMYSIHFGNDKAKRLKIDSYIGLSADYVPLHETKLEDQYVTIRRTISVLKEESPKYVELIEKKDNLLSLSRWKKLMLCASILSTPVYREDKLEYSQDWIDEFRGKLEYKKKLTFADAAYAKEEIYVDGVFCQGYADAEIVNFGAMSKLYFIQSFDNKDSVIVVKEDSARQVFLSKYFKKVPVLTNAHEPITEGTLHQNYISFSNEF